MAKIEENNDSLILELSNGQEVELTEYWEIDEDSYPYVEIWDCDSSRVIGGYRGNLPDMDDEDFDKDEFISFIEGIIR